MTRLEQGQNVGVLEPGRRGDFPVEALGPQRGRELGAQHLDGDLALVFQVLCEVYRGHPARAELALEAVMAGERLHEALIGVGHGD